MVEIEPEEEVETPYELPLWIIISSAVAGIVLLGIIILILWKVRPHCSDYTLRNFSSDMSPHVLLANRLIWMTFIRLSLKSNLSLTLTPLVYPLIHHPPPSPSVASSRGLAGGKCMKPRPRKLRWRSSPLRQRGWLRTTKAPMCFLKHTPMGIWGKLMSYQAWGGTQLNTLFLSPQLLLINRTNISSDFLSGKYSLLCYSYFLSYSPDS